MTDRVSLLLGEIVILKEVITVMFYEQLPQF